MTLSHSPQFRSIAITGASSGLGAALALHYAEPGRALHLNGRDVGRLKQVMEDCKAKGASVTIAQADVTEVDAIANWLLKADDRAPVDLVLAAAGIGGAAVMTDRGPETAALAGQIVTVNTLGVINAITPLLPRMMARKSGALVIIGSISGDVGLPQSPAYCASKAAVGIYADALRRLLSAHGISVTSVLPGFVDTPMSRSLALSRPFCWSAEKAARHIARGVARGCGRIVFPWQLRVAIGLQKVLPLALTDFILSRSVRA